MADCGKIHQLKQAIPIMEYVRIGWNFPGIIDEGETRGKRTT
jgi:hypothetical protein